MAQYPYFRYSATPWGRGGVPQGAPRDKGASQVAKIKVYCAVLRCRSTFRRNVDSFRQFRQPGLKPCAHIMHDPSCMCQTLPCVRSALPRRSLGSIASTMPRHHSLDNASTRPRCLDAVYTSDQPRRLLRASTLASTLASTRPRCLEARAQLRNE